MFVFGSKSRENLIGVHPDLVLVVSRALYFSAVDFRVQEGLRSSVRQWKLYNEGVSKTLESKHMQQQDGLGWAIDLVAVGDLNLDGRVDHRDSKLIWEPSLYHAIADAMMKSADQLSIDIRWGGQFKSFFDGPHFELVRR